MKSKRNSFVVNLIETTNGFSVIQGSQLLNKSLTDKADKEKTAQSAQQSSQISSILNSISLSKGQPSHNSHMNIGKENKHIYQKVNLVFPRLPQESGRQSALLQEQSQERSKESDYTHLNQLLKKNASTDDQNSLEWFSMAKVHQKQKSELRLWYSEQHPSSSSSSKSSIIAFPLQTDQFPSESIGSAEQKHEFKKYIQKYKNHRNIIIKMYYQNCHQKQLYLTCADVRKRIPSDAYWLMKLHSFLTNSLIINCNSVKHHDMETSPNEYVYKFNLEKGKFEMLSFEFDLRTDREKANRKRPAKGQMLFQSMQRGETEQMQTKGQANKQKVIQSEQQQALSPSSMPMKMSNPNQVLKDITTNIRPFCDHCGIHCGIVWFEHSKHIDSKEIASIMKKVNSTKAPLSDKPYELILCTRCYCDGSFPLLLTHHDFKKLTINDKLQPNSKKKKKKSKKKSKKRKRIEKQRNRKREAKEEEQEEQDGQEEIFEQKEYEQNEKEKDQNHQQEHQIGLEQRKQNEMVAETEEINKKVQMKIAEEGDSEEALKIDYSKKQNEARNSLNAKEAKQLEQGNKEKFVTVEQQAAATVPSNTVSSNIENILASLTEQKNWNLEETLQFLELIEKHRQNWNAIKDELSSKKPAYSGSLQQLVSYFISLPKRGVTKLKEQYEPEQFLLENYKINRGNMSDKMAERTLNRCIKMHRKLNTQPNKFPQIQPQAWTWKRNLERYIELQKSKMTQRLDHLQDLESLSKQVRRKFYKVVNNPVI